MAMDRHPLAVLIEQVKQENDWSDEYLATRARRRGHSISKQHIANLRATDPLKSIVPSTIRALQEALGVPLGRVVEAAILAAGLPLPSTPADWSIEAAITADPELPDAAKRMLISMLQAARSERATPGRRWADITPLPVPRAAGKAARRDEK